MTADDDGLLNGLPRTRPSVTTSRRAEARRAAGTRDDGDERRPGPAGAAQAPDPKLDAAVAPDSSVASPEQLIASSIGLAANTAAAGVRLAGRAAGGIGRALRR